MVDGEWTPFRMFFSSHLFDDFETWDMLLYSLLMTMCGSRTGGWSLPSVMSD
jgi:hypothetical protein